MNRGKARFNKRAILHWSAAVLWREIVFFEMAENGLKWPQVTSNDLGGQRSMKQLFMILHLLQLLFYGTFAETAVLATFLNFFPTTRTTTTTTTRTTTTIIRH